jgi:hypothetical protein
MAIRQSESSDKGQILKQEPISKTTPFLHILASLEQMKVIE